jgi:uncharacterized coiled-coil protein SlyX
MTENAINADSQVALANTLEKLNHTLGNLNTTMEKIQQGYEAQKRILGPKTKIFVKFTAATLTGLVVLYLFFLLYAMGGTMESMRGEMGETQRHMEQIAHSMVTMSEHMQIMTGQITVMGKTLQGIHHLQEQRYKSGDLSEKTKKE